MRADAVARRARLVQAARRLAAQHGADVPLDTVAGAAGVGIATLYRNFPGRPQLMDAVALAVVADVAAAGERAAEALDAAGIGAAGAAGGEADGGREAWVRLLRELLALDLGALTEALDAHRRGDVGADVIQARDGAVEVLAEVISRLQQAQVVRPGLDVPGLIGAIGVITRPQPSAPAAGAGPTPGQDSFSGAADPVVEQLAEAYIGWTLGR